VIVRGNVIACDWCEQQLMVGQVSKHASKQDREEMARARAVAWGWGSAAKGDYCPDHRKEALAPERSARSRGMVQRALLGGRRGRAQAPYGVPSFGAGNVKEA
jgi:hypothetical protein